MSFLTPRTGIVLTALAAIASSAPADAAEFQIEGSYRARARAYDTLSLDRSLTGSEGLAAYAQHRLLLRPKLLVNSRIGIFTDIRALDGVPWGTEAAQWIDPSSGATPLLFSDDVTPPTDAPLLNLTLWRAWTEVDTKFGRFSVGRMPLHWGMGMWQNSGGGFNADYGDTVDRVQWEHVFKGFFFRVAVDVNAESLLNETDDVTSFNAALAIRREVVDVGLNLQLRHAGRPGGNDFTLFSADLAGDLELGPLRAKAEVIAQVGGGDLEDGRNDVQVLAIGAVGDVNLSLQKFEFGVLGGMATGDGNPNDSTLRQFTYDRDFNVGIVMFEQPLPTLAAAATSEDEDGRDTDAALSGPAVSNALFVKPRVRRDIYKGLAAEASLLAARTLEAPASVNDEARSSYGMEIMGSVLYEGLDHIELSGTAGVFLPGSFYQNASLDSDYSSPTFAGQLLGRVRF